MILSIDVAIRDFCNSWSSMFSHGHENFAELYWLKIDLVSQCG